jgi:hypothetical protein
MGEKMVLFEMVDKACDTLEQAQKTAAKTDRPANACPAHDAQFALGQALATGVSALLSLKRDEMRDAIENPESRAAPESPEPPFGEFSKTLVLIRALTPWRWPLAFAACSPFAGDITGMIISAFKA